MSLFGNLFNKCDVVVYETAWDGSIIRKFYDPNGREVSIKFVNGRSVSDDPLLDNLPEIDERTIGEFLKQGGHVEEQCNDQFDMPTYDPNNNGYWDGVG